ncbi:DMT family transporter [Paenibacillus turpanensis]|uniref:DMT family transporter n=1 Tax=Paenibacillus turpanensis TaxID=2689078 RepID=UPI0014097066|nr:DMT family transporter [Paenibacillus turpanensis]
MDKKSLYTNVKFVALIASICCLLWGSAYPSIKIGYQLFNISAGDIPSQFVFAGYRFILAGVILLIVARAFGRKVFSFSAKQFGSLAVLGLAQTTLQYIFFYIGLANTTGVKGSIMNSTGTFFSVILAHYIYKNDKLSANKALGCLVGFIGVMVVNFSSNLLDFSFRFVGEGFVIIAALVFSVAAIYAKKLTKTMEVILVTGYSLFLGGIALTLLGMFYGGEVHSFTLASASILIYLAVLSSLAFSLWNMLLKYNKVGSVSVYNFLIPIFGAILSSIFLGETIMEIKNIVALLFVSFGIWMVNKESMKANRLVGKVEGIGS